MALLEASDLVIVFIGESSSKEQPELAKVFERHKKENKNQVENVIVPSTENTTIENFWVFSLTEKKENSIRVILSKFEVLQWEG